MGEGVQKRHLHTCYSRHLAVKDRPQQLREDTPAGSILPLKQFGTATSSRQGRFLCFSCAGGKGGTFPVTHAAILECDRDKHVACFSGCACRDGEWLQQRYVQWFDDNGTNSGA